MRFNSVAEYNEWLTKQLEEKATKKPAAKKAPAKPKTVTKD